MEAIIKHVLFVCTGNTCRSPMAEALFRAKTDKNIEGKSAGIYAMPGMPASDGTMKVLKERNITLKHDSKPLTEELVDWADIILTMTKNHHEMTVQTYPKAADKIFTLKEFALDANTDMGDIQDPIGGSTDTYRATAEEMDWLLEAALHKIKKF
ncbi:low molecular weight protein arginine phosphatase [Alteribacillus bidgolensis]|uniref:Protein-tyrosine phosphatase n=1 Tax=Alteribacillus bidgolensis TaxID=930129 RepID=A0A1G8M278_9BACI|nr:low molecular weight protein arginine phosphatase [Alteribacillus bidgolensis]SDI61963.1 protein-tyrosine phosphatase [Alteribacillus bidgolensis]